MDTMERALRERLTTLTSERDRLVTEMRAAEQHQAQRGAWVNQLVGRIAEVELILSGFGQPAAPAAATDAAAPVVNGLAAPAGE